MEQTDIQTTLISKFNRIGKLRDGFLVSGLIFYGVGYLFWSIYAAYNNLGFLPALDLQYFIAGFIPTCILIISYYLGKYLQKFLLNTWPKKVGLNASGLWKVVRVFFIGFFLLSIIMLFFANLPGIILAFIILYVLYRLTPIIEKINNTFLQNLIKIIAALVAIGCLFLIWKNDSIENYLSEMDFFLVQYNEVYITYIFLIAILFVPPFGFPYSEILKRLYFFMTLIFVPLLGLIFYWESLYPKIPQDFGGVKPRFAQFDIKTSVLSDEVFLAIIPEGGKDSSQNIMRTKLMKVFYSNQNILLAKPSTTRDSSDFIYEIKRSDLHSIYWVGRNPEH